MATSAAAKSSHLHGQSASTPQQQHQKQPLQLSQQARPVTISHRQFGPPPEARPSSALAVASPSNNDGRPTPPPKSPQSRPMSTAGGANGMNGSHAPSVACPICNISLRNLAQLNLHLDTIHPEEPEDVKTAVSTFFRNAQKVLNPITRSATSTLKNIPANSSELLRKIQDLDLDSAGPGNSLAGPPPPGGFQGWTDPRADAVVTKRHWVRESDRDVCFQPNCDKGLGIRYGRQHCRRCGNVFCEMHSSFQIKLNAQAKHDANGLWCRVCETCFVQAKKADDSLHAGGVSRNLTTDFMSIRARSAEKKHLEVNRLEKRIEKLAQIHQQYGTGVSSSPIPSSPTGSFTSVSSGTGSVRAKGLLRSVTSKGQQLKAAEQAIVKWEDDSSVPACYICLSMFNRYGNRKHHCRLCGRVICDNCSKSTPLYLNMVSYPDGSASVGNTRACKDCMHTVFKRREHAADRRRPNAVLKYYGSLMRLKKRIDSALPRFQEMLTTLGQKSDMNQAHPDYQLAARTRKELLDDFALFDAISKKIAKLPAHSQHQKQLHTNLYWWATQYLQTNMFPLSVIPKVFGKDPKAQGPGSLSSSPSLSTSSPRLDSAQENEAAIESLAQLAVLEEQRRLVESYIEEASRKRKFDDVKSLTMSLEELESEIAAVRSGQRLPAPASHSCIIPHTSGERVVMSTSSDGHKVGRVEDPLVLRKKYDHAKLRLRDKAEELGDAQVGYDKVKKKNETLERKNETLERMMAKMKVDLKNTEEMLERTRRQAAAPLNAMEEIQRRRNRDEYHRFAGVMRFLEDSLQFIPPAHEGEPIESRLATVIMRISEKEKEYEKMKQKLGAREDEDMVARAARLGQEGQEGYTPQPLEATLTRVMKASEEKIAKLTEELEAVKEQESTWRNNSDYFEQKFSQLTADHDKALADLEEAQAKEDNLTKLLTRSEKGKTAMQQSIDVKEKELSALKRRYELLQGEFKEKEKSLAKQKQQYDIVKTRSLVQDLDRISALEGRLRDADREVIRSQKLVKEKDDLLTTTKSKMWRLEEERNEGLQQLGHLQEELADKDLQLSNARAASGSIESFKKIAERERASATQRANQEMEMLKQSLALVKKLADDREKETAFMKDAVHGSEEKILHLESRLETVSNQVKKRDDDAALFKSTIHSLESELAKYRHTSDSYAFEAKGYAQKERTQQDLLSYLQKKVDAFDSVEQIQSHGNEALLTLRRRIDELNTSLSAPNSQALSHHVGTDKQIKEELVKTSLELLYALQKVSSLQQYTRDEGRQQYESEIARLKRTNQEVQKQRDSLRKEIQELRSSMVDLSCVKIEPGVVTAEPLSEEMVLDLGRALATVGVLEELVSTLEDEVVQMKRSREEMTKVDEILRQTIQEIEFDKVQLTEKVAKLERDLGRREDDLKSKLEELASSQAKVHEQTLRGDGLEQRLQGVQRQMDLLEQDYAEQKQQLEGRESALRRLEQARNTYDKVYESKIDLLKEEIKTVEKLSRTQWEKLTATHTKEMQKTIDQCMTSLNEAQRTQSEAGLSLNSEYLAVVAERDALKTEVVELKESLEKTMKEIDDRHLLITGYMSLVSQQEGEGMLTEGSETLKGLLQQNQDQMATIEQLNQHLDILRTALDDQIQIIMESNQNTDTLASNQERYLRQISELQDELSTLKTAHKMDLLQLKAMEKELSEKTELLLTLTPNANSHSNSNSTSTLSGPEVSAPGDEPMPPAPTQASSSS